MNVSEFDAAVVSRQIAPLEDASQDGALVDKLHELLDNQSSYWYVEFDGGSVRYILLPNLDSIKDKLLEVWRAAKDDYIEDDAEDLFRDHYQFVDDYPIVRENGCREYTIVSHLDAIKTARDQMAI